MDLLTMAGGALQEALAHEVKRLAADIRDPNKARVRRSITVTLSFVPAGKGNVWNVQAQVKRQPGPLLPVETQVMVGREHGEDIMREIVQQDLFPKGEPGKIVEMGGAGNDR